jgi:branched-chain amino acid transport system permease protein
MLLLVLVLLLPLELNQYRNFILSQVGIYVLMGVGLNIVVGLAGLLDLGYVAFFALGAYTYGLLSGGVPQAGPNPRCDPEWVAPFWLALALGIAVATLAGVGLGVPVLRMRGDYLAIVTLGFGEIIRLVVQTLVTCTGGPNGIQRIPVPSAAVGGISWAANTNRELVYLVAACAALAIFITHRLNHSRVGRAWIAMREDEDVAEAMGISLVRYKLLAFAIGASFAGAAGVLYAARQRAVFPTDFSLLVSINVLSLIILGGMGSLPGVVLGAGALVGLPELLREFAEYRLVLYGALLVAMMILRPEGLLPSRRRALEIHAEETGPEPALRAAEVASRPGRAPPDPPSRAARASRDRGSSHGP